MVGRHVVLFRMASGGMLPKMLLLISALVSQVAGAGQTAFSHLVPGSVGQFRLSSCSAGTAPRRVGLRVAEDLSMTGRGAGATMPAEGAHFWAAATGGTSAPPGRDRGCTCERNVQFPREKLTRCVVCAGEVPASVEMSPALSAALEAATTMTLRPRTMVAGNRLGRMPMRGLGEDATGEDSDEWDNVAAPRSLSAYLAAPSGMVLPC